MIWAVLGFLLWVWLGMAIHILRESETDPGREPECLRWTQARPVFSQLVTEREIRTALLRYILPGGKHRIVGVVPGRLAFYVAPGGWRAIIALAQFTFAQRFLAALRATVSAVIWIEKKHYERDLYWHRLKQRREWA